MMACSSLGMRSALFGLLMALSHFSLYSWSLSARVFSKYWRFLGDMAGFASCFSIAVLFFCRLRISLISSLSVFSIITL